jgi:hypothetical protein
MAGVITHPCATKIRTDWGDSQRVAVPDFLLNLVTFGITASRSFEISGDKIK